MVFPDDWYCLCCVFCELGVGYEDDVSGLIGGVSFCVDVAVALAYSHFS